MKPSLRGTFCCLLTALMVLPGVARAQWVDNFDTINPAWVTDRYEPAGFQSVVFLGDNRLQISINQTGSAANRPAPTYTAEFFNTQGRQRPVGIIGEWSLSAEVYVSSAYDTTTGQLVSTSLWGQTGTSLVDSTFAEIGFTNASPTDPLNPDAPDRAFRFQVFDETGNWTSVGVPSGFTFDAWHTLQATGSGTDIEYEIDGAVVFALSSVVGNNLQTAFIQAYNFGQVDSHGLNSYDVYWDHAVAAVPEPASFALAFALAALAWAQRRAGSFRG